MSKLTEEQMFVALLAAIAGMGHPFDRVKLAIEIIDQTKKQTGGSHARTEEMDSQDVD